MQIRTNNTVLDIDPVDEQEVLTAIGEDGSVKHNIVYITRLCCTMLGNLALLSH